jgi:hypothetical protein
MLQISSSIETVFDGTQFYWRTRTSVDVVILQHKSQRVFEVIVYEPVLDIEAPRLYLDETVLMTKVDHNEIDTKLSFAKRNNVPLTERFVSGIVHKAVADFILGRLVIQDLSVAEKKFVVGLRVDESEIMLHPEYQELVCACPVGVIVQQTRHFKHLM